MSKDEIARLREEKAALHAENSDLVVARELLRDERDARVEQCVQYRESLDRWEERAKKAEERVAALTFRRLQDEQRPWVEHNFAGREPWKPLVGAMEELGELAHAHLKWIPRAIEGRP